MIWSVPNFNALPKNSVEADDQVRLITGIYVAAISMIISFISPSANTGMMLDNLGRIAINYLSLGEHIPLNIVSCLLLGYLVMVILQFFRLHRIVVSKLGIRRRFEHANIIVPLTRAVPRLNTTEKDRCIANTKASEFLHDHFLRLLYWSYTGGTPTKVGAVNAHDSCSAFAAWRNLYFLINVCCMNLILIFLVTIFYFNGLNGYTTISLISLPILLCALALIAVECGVSIRTKFTAHQIEQIKRHVDFGEAARDAVKFCANENNIPT